MKLPLAPNPAKAACERWWLIYTPIWGLVSGSVMLSGWAESWGDGAAMTFGVLIAAGAMVPMVRPHESERALPWRDRPGVKLSASVFLFALGLNWVQTPFFFDVLHMHYGFRVTWVIDRNPIFLYLVTVAYFGTYQVLCSMAFRVLQPKTKWGAWILAPMLMALLETALNANPFIDRLFCYDDMTLMLTFGTLVYGVSLALVLPIWMTIDEEDHGSVSLGAVVVGLAAILFFDDLFLEVMRHHVAPHLTTVVENAQGLGPVSGSCLAP